MASIFANFFADGTWQNASPDDPGAWTWFTNLFGGRKTTSGETITPESAMSLSSYYACIRNISEDVGKLPIKVYERLERGKKPAPNHPVYRILHDEPNPEMSSMVFRETLQAWALGWGNGYAEIERTNGGTPLALHPIHPSRVKYKRRADGTAYYEIRNNDNSVTELGISDVFHVRGLGGDGYTGYSVLQVAAETIGLGIALQKFGAAYFGNGVTLSGVLSTAKALGKEGRKNLRESWMEQYSGAANSNKLAVLEEDMKFQTITIPADQAQFIQSRQFAVEEMARTLRMPPHKIGHLERATNNNIEHQSLEYVGDTIEPWTTRWQQEASRKLFTEIEREKYFVEHDFKGLLRTDHAARAAFHREMVNIGAKTPNMVADDENENPNPDPSGDEYYMQMNMTTLKRIVNPPEPPKSEGPTSPFKPKEPPQKPQNQALFVKSQAHAFKDAANRVIRKETMAISRLAKKFAGKPAAFADEAGKFYAEHKSYVYDAFAPLIEGMCDMFEGGHDTALSLMKDYAEAHCGSSRIAACGSFDVIAKSGEWIHPLTENLATKPLTFAKYEASELDAPKETATSPVSVNVNVRGEHAIKKRFEVIRDANNKITAITATEEVSNGK